MENILVFRTNINSSEQCMAIEPILNALPAISEWSVDLEDREKILRVVANTQLSELDIYLMLKRVGFTCEALAD